jgi:large subunit ribosomal protein L31e
MTEKKPKKTDKEKIEEKIYVIPLRSEFRKVAQYRRTEKAIKAIKEFLAQHMKIYDRDLKKIKLDSYVNEFMWARGIKNPPHKIKVKAIKDINGIVKVELVDYPDKLKFKKARAEKEEKAMSDKKQKKKAVEEKVKEEAKPEEEKDEKKVEEEEKKASTIEAGIELEKAAAKTMKHQVGGKTKEPKHQRRMALQK